MSLHSALKGIDPVLRGLMNRRDRLRASVSKHAAVVVSATKRINKVTANLENLRDTTAETIAALTDDITLHEDYRDKAAALLKIAELEVNKRLDELGATG